MQTTGRRPQHGLFKLMVMTFNLCNAPATFQQLMNIILSQSPDTAVSSLLTVDDIIVKGWNFEEYLQSFSIVLQKLKSLCEAS